MSTPENLQPIETPEASSPESQGPRPANARPDTDANQESETVPKAPPPKSETAAPATAKPDTSTSQQPESPPESHVLKYAEWYAAGAFFVLAVIWLCFLPLRTSRAYAPNPEDDLHDRLNKAEAAAKAQTVNRSALLRPREVAVALVEVDHPADPAPAKDWVKELDELRTDLTVWNRYEDELRNFKWGADFNWYMNSSLRVLVIILSAITPALIVAPVFAKKKFLAALPAALVAIGTGCIVEFDFRTQAATNDIAHAQIEGEKAAFITKSKPLYIDSAQSTPAGETPAESVPGGSTPAKGKTAGNTAATGKTPAANKQNKKTGGNQEAKTDRLQTGLEPACTLAEGGVPFPEPSTYQQARANFACRMQQIVEIHTGQRVQFLRGQPTTPQPKKQQ